MAKKVTRKKKVVEEVVSRKSEITNEDIINLAKSKNYNGSNSIYEIQAWIRNQHNLHAELFFSMFHKKWSINNYFINTSTYKKVEWQSTSTMYDTHDDALRVSLYHLINLI